MFETSAPFFAPSSEQSIHRTVDTRPHLVHIGQAYQLSLNLGVLVVKVLLAFAEVGIHAGNVSVEVGHLAIQ